ncbi:hypothetical protein IX39_01565 [Chryseobacterium formosense]|uniref:Uncharacterized protein n=1 Tax=Chryseobacterium formosense TaxID=236814 RepID=A0A085Z4M4_9FLAO|nr:hypothetical protein [Chryseobacterium formosense]KFE99387.1 hypothetical protein IX39_01565 [Chryseobacterium formosense]SFT53560.1 hypothetical protein SAMN05421857_1358 [Chryseobacterium formosense]
MKTFLKNQYAYVNQVLIAVVSAVLGYNLYQEIVHPENSRLTISIILVVLTYILVEKYGYKPEKEIEK